MAGQEYVLEMTNVMKAFPGVKALDDVTFRLRKGTVHALMGENGAGKSTLMKCLFGVYKEDAGIISIDGVISRYDNPKQALDNGVAMVHQELNQVLRRSVMENIWLGRFPIKYGLISHKKMYDSTKELFNRLNIDVNPKEMIGNLSVSQRQMVEIAKAVSYNARILVLDEPTSSLTDIEVEHLFTIINRLRDDGVGVVYISHKMEEILKISDEVTIMRDGSWVATKPAKELTTDDIIKLMVGRDLTERFPEKTNKPSEVLMEIKNLTGRYEPSCKNISLDLRKGEILGIAGLMGSGRTELLETIFGTATKESGEITINNTEIDNKNSTKAIANKFAFITEERRANGIFPLGSVRFNSIIANIKNYTRFKIINDKKMSEDTVWVIDSFNVKTPSEKTHIRNLSGGNQQKVIIGRWLLTKPDILLLDEPTRGIDVGAKFEIYQFIIELATENKGIMIVSSEMPELIGICDRIAVMSNGKLAGILDVKSDNKKELQEEIMRLSAMYL